MRGTVLAVLHDDHDMVLVLNDFTRKRGAFAYPEDSDMHHIGCIQDSREQVDALNARLRVDGWADGWAVPEPRASQGAWTFYDRGWGSYVIEVATRTGLRRAEPAVAWHSIAARTLRRHRDDRFCRVARRQRSEETRPGAAIRCPTHPGHAGGHRGFLDHGPSSHIRPITSGITVLRSSAR